MPTRGITKTKKPTIKKKKSTVKKSVAALSRMSATAPSTENTKTVYFWHPQDNNGYLSQWYDCPFEHEGVKYATAEMWMMIQKAKLFGDEVSRILVVKVDNYSEKNIY